VAGAGQLVRGQRVAEVEADRLVAFETAEDRELFLGLDAFGDDHQVERVGQVEDVAKNEWKGTLERAAQFGVTNEYVKKARENLSKYLPDEFPFVKDERPQREEP